MLGGLFLVDWGSLTSLKSQILDQWLNVFRRTCAQGFYILRTYFNFRDKISDRYFRSTFYCPRPHSDETYINGNLSSKTFWPNITYVYINFDGSRPRWSPGNVLASRSEVRGLKPDRCQWIFSRSKTPEHKSSRRDFKLGVPNLRFQACQRTSSLEK